MCVAMRGGPELDLQTQSQGPDPTQSPVSPAPRIRTMVPSPGNAGGEEPADSREDKTLAGTNRETGTSNTVEGLL